MYATKRAIAQRIVQVRDSKATISQLLVVVEKEKDSRAIATTAASRGIEK